MTTRISVFWRSIPFATRTNPGRFSPVMFGLCFALLRGISRGEILFFFFGPRGMKYRLILSAVRFFTYT